MPETQHRHNLQTSGHSCCGHHGSGLPVLAPKRVVLRLEGPERAQRGRRRGRERLTCRWQGRVRQCRAVWPGCVGHCRTCGAALEAPHQRCPPHSQACAVLHAAAAGLLVILHLETRATTGCEHCHVQGVYLVQSHVLCHQLTSRFSILSS